MLSIAPTLRTLWPNWESMKAGSVIGWRIPDAAGLGPFSSGTSMLQVVGGTLCVCDARWARLLAEVAAVSRVYFAFVFALQVSKWLTI